jgi:hypothetical protein
VGEYKFLEIILQLMGQPAEADYKWGLASGSEYIHAVNQASLLCKLAAFWL